jgi:hypothetical protein
MENCQNERPQLATVFLPTFFSASLSALFALLKKLIKNKNIKELLK